jgi:hypothetical protein
MEHVAKPGPRVFYDTFAGPIRAKLLPVTVTENGAPSFLDIELSESVGAYRQGEVIRHCAPRYVVPAPALKVGPCGVFRILPFTWSMQA